MHSNRGFTLIELMVVVVIITILAAIGIPNYLTMQDRAYEAMIRCNGHTTQLALESFSSMNGGSYPPEATAMADIVAQLPGGLVYDNPFAGGGGLSVCAGPNEGMCDYQDPAAVGASNQYRINCYGRGAAFILSLSNG